MDTRPLLLVLAGNHRQFKTHEHQFYKYGFHPKYTDNPELARGYGPGIKFACVGTWWENPNAAILLTILKSRGHKEITGWED